MIIDPKERRLATLAGGLLAGLALAYISFVFASPFRWSLQFPGRMFYVPLHLLGAAGLSVIAAKSGSRSWYWLTAWAGALLIYCFFFYRLPMWV